MAAPSQQPAQLRARAALAVHAARWRGVRLETSLGAQAPALLTELAYGACRHYHSLAGCVDTRLARPLKRRDLALHALLVVGAYQLRHTRIPPHAAVSETVAATAHLRRPWAKGLVNATLRHLLRTAPAPANAAQRWDHPEWMLTAFEAAWPADCPTLFQANNSRAPMALRVNVAKVGVATYRERLGAAGLTHRQGLTPATLVLDAPTRADTLPGFHDGCVSVQDEGAQLAATLLPAPPGGRMLDACAAPGSKAFHFQEQHPRVHVTALDADPERLDHLRDEARRLGHRLADAIVGDATSNGWWDGEPFDAILVDAPCSGTGTLRRHPDIKVSRSAAAVTRAAAKQRAMLANLWHMLSPGGTLLYCVCSILPEETDAVVTSFARATPDAVVKPINAAWGRPTAGGRMLLPTCGGPDGFYYARIDKP